LQYLSPPQNPYVIDANLDEFFLKIPNFIVIDLDEIMELSNSQFYPQANHTRNKQKLGVGGIGKKFCKKSYDNNRKF
jgi:hypothetical protein